MSSSFALPSHAVLRRVTQVLATLGAIWGIPAVLYALDAIGPDSSLLIGDGRTGWGIGVAAVIAWICAVVGIALAQLRPALAAALIFVAALAGFLLLGGTWIGPGVLLGVASWSGLLGIDNPFEEEMNQERAAAEAPDV